MAERMNQKLKILYLMKILLEKTDETHSITVQEMITALAAYGITAERKSLYSDLESLRTYGLDVIGVQENRNYYYHVGNRQFELAELKLLVDSVQSARFITARKSAELIHKIEGLASQYEASKLNRQVYVTERVKTMNESIYYNVDSIHTAISENAQIRFQYFNWNVDKEMLLRRNGGYYEISPWALTWNDMAVYERKMFGMFDGREENVKLLCDNAMAGIMIDRFGKNVPFLKKDAEHFVMNVKVAVSRQFFSWVMGLGSGVQIIGPVWVVDEMKEEIRRLAQQYLQENQHESGITGSDEKI